MSSSRRVVAIIAALLAVLLAACQPTPPQDPTQQVDVAGSFAQRPVVRFTTPMPVTEIATRELITGDGKPLADGDAVLLSFLAIDATTGEIVDDSYGGEPRILALSQDEAGPLYSDLLGRTEGTRLLRLEPGSLTRPDPVVIIYDILFTAAHGEELEPQAGLPVVTRAADGTPAITLPDADPPTSLVISPLIRGDGPQVQSGESVTVRFVQLAWTANSVVDTTWGPGSRPVTIPLVDRIPGLQDGLVDATVGSQVLLVVPPDQADGTDTMVFVVDVLAVTSQAAAEEAG